MQMRNYNDTNPSCFSGTAGSSPSPTNSRSQEGSMGQEDVEDLFEDWTRMELTRRTSQGVLPNRPLSSFVIEHSNHLLEEVNEALDEENARFDLLFNVVPTRNDRSSRHSTDGGYHFNDENELIRQPKAMLDMVDAALAIVDEDDFMMDYGAFYHEETFSSRKASGGGQKLQ